MDPSMQNYVKLLVDPFGQPGVQPKLYDGSVSRSSGIKFRNVGTMVLDGTGAANYIILYPGFSIGLNWKTTAGGPLFPPPNPNHLSNPAERNNLKQIRLVSSGLKLSLENSSDENEGFWEAVRIPINYSDFILYDSSAPVGEDYTIGVTNIFSMPELANHQTYQSGRLKDIHRYLFKLNSVAPDHPFKRVVPGSSVPSVPDCMDDFFDVIVIKVTGRIDAVTPSTLRYDAISNQEVVYAENTSLSRLHTISPMIKDTDVVLDKTRFLLPAIQIA